MCCLLMPMMCGASNWGLCSPSWDPQEVVRAISMAIETAGPLQGILAGELRERAPE